MFGQFRNSLYFCTVKQRKKKQVKQLKQQVMNAKEIEKLKETVSATGSAIYGSDTEEYKILNELSDEDIFIIC